MSAPRASPVRLRVLVTLLGLLLPWVLSQIPLPVTNDRVRTVLSEDGQLPLAVSMAAVLLVPWISGAVLVAFVRAWVPRWRAAARSPQREGGMERASTIVGVVGLLLQAFGLALYFEDSGFLRDLPGARWIALLAVVGASCLVRLAASAVSSHGLADGMAILLAGELIATSAAELRGSDLLGSFVSLSADERMSAALAAAGCIALTLVLSGALPVRQAVGKRWELPLFAPSGLLPLAAALALQNLLVAPLHALGSLALPLSYPTQLGILKESTLSTALVLGSTLALGLWIAAPQRVARTFAALNVPPAMARSWFTGAIVANGAWLLFVMYAARVTLLGSGVARAIVLLFVARDVWLELSARRSGPLIPIAVLPDVVVAAAASHALVKSEITHIVRGLAPRKLFHVLAPFSPLVLCVAGADVERARATLTPLSALLRSLASSAARP